MIILLHNKLYFISNILTDTNYVKYRSMNQNIHIGIVLTIESAM